MTDYNSYRESYSGWPNYVKKEPSYEFERVLVTSTAMVTRKDMELMELNWNNSGQPLAIAYHPWGAFVRVCRVDAETETDLLNFGYSEALINLIRYIRHTFPDVHWINLDADGLSLDDLPEQTWD
jgi:hypothetical protein